MQSTTTQSNNMKIAVFLMLIMGLAVTITADCEVNRCLRIAAIVKEVNLDPDLNCAFVSNVASCLDNIRLTCDVLTDKNKADIQLAVDSLRSRLISSCDKDSLCQMNDSTNTVSAEKGIILTVPLLTIFYSLYR